VAEQERLIELLKEKRQAAISHAVTKGLNPDAPMKDSGVEWVGEVPAHWRVGRIKDIVASLEQGWSPEPSPQISARTSWIMGSSATRRVNAATRGRARWAGMLGSRS